MAKLFLSHSTKDKEFAVRLASDLQDLGHLVWLDAWKIGVGQIITEEIQKGIADSDFVIIVLSSHSVESKWVEREWQPKYWEEIRQNKILVLPALLETCKIPTLLEGRRYADFRKNYIVGVVALNEALGEPKVIPSEDWFEILGFVVDNLLPVWELTHLQQLEEEPLTEPRSRYYKNELFALQARGCIRQMAGKHISDMSDRSLLGEFVEITDKGRAFLETRRKVLKTRKGKLE